MRYGILLTAHEFDLVTRRFSVQLEDWVTQKLK